MSILRTYFQEALTFTAWHSHPDKQSRVLITAGMDGDEYCGIEAAKKLIKTYRGDIPITVIPLVNSAGNEQKVSYNPLDGRYPKHVYPGSRWGSSTSRLMHKVGTYAEKIDLWIDLHGGATDEHLKPFVWAAKSGNPQVDRRTESILSHLAGTAVYETIPTLAPSLPLARHNTSYIIVESGEMGQVKDIWVDYHLTTIKHSLSHLDSTPLLDWQPTYTQVVYKKNPSTIPPNTLWYSPTLAAVGV